jgi:PAS domain S-box-containing protein
MTKLSTPTELILAAATAGREAEEALRRNAEAFAALVEQAPLGIYTVDSKFRIRNVSAGAMPAFRSVRPLIGRDFGEAMRILWPEPFAGEAIAIFRHTLETGEPYVSPGLTEKRNDIGAIESYEWQVNRVMLADGQYGVVCYFFDTTRIQQAHRAVRDSEERFRTFINATSNVVYRMSADWKQMRYLDGKEFIAETKDASHTWIDKYIPAADRRLVMEEIQRAIQSKTVFELEHRVIRTDGSLGWVSSRAIPIFDERGEIREWFGAASDVTQRKEAEEALRRSEERLRLAQQVARIGSFEWNLQEERSRWSPELEALYGLPPGGFKGTYEAWAAMVHPEDWPETERIHREAMETGLLEAEWRVVWPDRSVHWVAARGQVFRDDAGKPLRMVGVNLDITASKCADEALREQRERAEFVAYASDVGFFFCDLPFDKLIWDERVKNHFWLPPDADVTIHTFYKQIHPEDRELTRLAIEESIANNTRYEVEYRTVAPDGRQRWVRAIGRTFYSESGKPVRFDGITLDVTKRKQAEEALRASEAKYKNLFENMAEEVHFWQLVRDETGEIKTWRLVDANPPALRTWGKPGIESVRGKTTDEIFGPGMADHYVPVVRKIMTEGRPHSFEDFNPILNRHFRFTSVPLGEYFITTGADVTAIKKAEIALRASEGRYRELAESLEQQVQDRTVELQARNRQVLLMYESLRALSTRLMKVQDEERRRIARDLHDSAGQLLAAISIQLSNLGTELRAAAPELREQVEETESIVNQLQKEIRTTSYLLHPPLLDEAGLYCALSWYVEGLNKRSDVQTELEMAADFGRLPRDMELAVFRLVQESLTNIHRHSGSKTATIRVARDERTITVEVRDEGKGIPPEKLLEIQSEGSGVGIRGMRERLRQFGGELKIESGGSGTRVWVTMGIPQAPVGEEESGVERMERAG